MTSAACKWSACEQTPIKRAVNATNNFAGTGVLYPKITSSHFARSYFHPDDMSFAKSDALFPPVDLASTIAAEYGGQCKVLCYGQYWPTPVLRYI
jgi:hypothetical protein